MRNHAIPRRCSRHCTNAAVVAPMTPGRFLLPEGFRHRTRLWGRLWPEDGWGTSSLAIARAGVWQQGCRLDCGCSSLSLLHGDPGRARMATVQRRRPDWLSRSEPSLGKATVAAVAFSFFRSRHSWERAELRKRNKYV